MVGARTGRAPSQAWEFMCVKGGKLGTTNNQKEEMKYGVIYWSARAVY